MAWALSRSVYHALGAATATARSQGYHEVTAAHLVAEMLHDPDSVVSRACCGGDALACEINDALAANAPKDPQWPATVVPVGFDPEVGEAILGTGADESATSGQVLLRLLHAPGCGGWRQMEALGVDVRDLVSRTEALVGAGALDGL